MYCSNCGNIISENAKFCSNCGSAVNAITTTNSVSIASSGSGDYRLVLVDRNKCSASTAEDLLMDLLGYSAEDADQLVDMAPIEIADNLSMVQARTLAQAFSEYGCQVSVVDENGEYVNASEKATSSVFDSDGNLLGKAALILGALTAVNKVTSYRRYRKPSLLEYLFRPRYSIVPPKPRRHRPMMQPHPMMNPFFNPFTKPAPAPRMKAPQPPRGRMHSRGGHPHAKGGPGMGGRGPGRR